MVRKILVKRKGHYRRGHVKKVRRKKVLVKPTMVKGSVYFTKDRGAPGKTHGSKAWSKKVKIPKSHEIVGYKIALPSKKRHTLLKSEVKERAKSGAARFKKLGKLKEGALSVKRYLGYQKNLNPSRKAKKTFGEDIKFVERKYKV